MGDDLTVVVTGAAGFIGHHLCNFLSDRGYYVRAVDYKEPVYPTRTMWDECAWYWDLRDPDYAEMALRNADWVFALAADMGGMGYIGKHHWTILTNNLAINLNTATAARQCGVKRIVYTSSACVYPEQLQGTTDAPNLQETDAWQGKPDTAYGVEKLASEDVYRLCGVDARVARFHNIYGPECTWYGGREKAPAALCRKIAQAKRSGDGVIDIWGDGEQTRSFCYIDDCLEALWRLMVCEPAVGPVNIGSDELTTINGLVDLIAAHAGVRIEKHHDLSKPQGVRGRNADLTLMRDTLGYRPRVTLADGMGRLYDWIERQVGG